MKIHPACKATASKPLARVGDKKPHVIANYIVHYDDENTETIPVMLGSNIAELYRPEITAG